MIRLVTPTTALLDLKGAEVDKVRKHLTYLDRRVDFELRKKTATLKKFTGRASTYIAERMGQEAFDQRLLELRGEVASLQALRKKCLLVECPEGFAAPSGLAEEIGGLLGQSVSRDYQLPEEGLLPWHRDPKYPARPYQVEAVEKLLEASSRGPCAVEFATGAGKSRVIMDLLKRLALRSLVMAPSTSIARQLYEELSSHLGPGKVGLFGDGVKQFDRQFVVAIDDSLTKVEEGTAAWKALSERDVFVVDESHLAPADTLNRVCYGLAARAPYRFFFSATQIRNDGLDLVLGGIVGNIVMRRSVKELVDQGYLARPLFRMVRVASNGSYTSRDPNEMTRHHLYYNPRVCREAARMANYFVSAMKRPVVMLVEELEQFGKLLPYLQHEVRFAHAPLQASGKKVVPPEYHAHKAKDLVKSFNQGDFPILVGTSCISTGTDLQVPGAVIYLQGGLSEIKVRQAVGRGTRGGLKSFVTNPLSGEQKVDCYHVDFDVIDTITGGDEFSPHRHAARRAEIYEEIYGPVKQVDRAE